MYDRKMKRKRFFAAVLAAVFVAGNLTNGMSGGIVQAAELTAESTVTQAAERAEAAVESSAETEEKNWYVLGRPMTEEEKEEQRQLIERYRSLSGGSLPKSSINIFCIQAAPLLVLIIQLKLNFFAFC